MLTALDDSGNDVFIEDAVVGQNYYCPCCGGIVRCRAKNSGKVREHFYHIDKTNCDGGEALLHKYWKHHLFDIGETINLPLIGEIKCVNKWIEYPTKDGKYRPDLIIKTNNPKYRFVVFEILNTNSKNVEKYNGIWKQYKYPVYEIDVKYLKVDKSNFDDCLKLLYIEEKQEFVRKSKQNIKELYRVLETYGCKVEWEDLMLLKTCLGKIYRIFKSNLNKPIRTNLHLIITKLNSTWVDRDVFINFTLPLIKITKQLLVYT